MIFEEMYNHCLRNKELISEFNRLLGYNKKKIVDLEEWKTSYQAFVREFIFNPNEENT